MSSSEPARDDEDILREQLHAMLRRLSRWQDRDGRQALLMAARKAIDEFAAASEEEGGRGASAAGVDDYELPSRYGIIGESEAIEAVFSLLDRVAQSEYAVLVTGESGSGKELVARALHEYGPRKKKVFVSENCAAIPETLLESILFGHAKGAFTGAHKDNPGHFVTADGGTLFLDELGDMPLVMQGKLLRVLQDGEVRAVGSEKLRHVDVRLVAATNKNLSQLVQEQRFREDLYYRLNVLEIRVPPLRERGEDILHIAEFFLRKARRELGRSALSFSDAAKKALLACPWPGNVRQLENEVRRAAALTDADRIERSALAI